MRGVYDPQFLRDYAVAHEEAGFDRVLVGQTATWPDPLSTAAHIAAVTKTLKFMVAHRPGFIAPTMAARMFATLDRASGGRAGVHIITGASDVETQADGDYLTKEQRYHRSREYVEILRRIWSSEVPFDHAGEWYRFNGAFALVKPVQEQIPVFWAGRSAPGRGSGARRPARQADRQFVVLFHARRHALRVVDGEPRAHQPDLARKGRLPRPASARGRRRHRACARDRRAGGGTDDPERHLFLRHQRRKLARRAADHDRGHVCRQGGGDRSCGHVHGRRLRTALAAALAASAAVGARRGCGVPAPDLGILRARQPAGALRDHRRRG
ncbi:alkanesulfonate monooxygenase [Sphingomonas sp. LH128]|nr:alkanesulfonate monooxygenase [Sphingomonas sp. LH128]